MSRVFGDKNLKAYLNTEPDIKHVTVDSHTDMLILASDGVSKVEFFSTVNSSAF